MTVPDYIMPVVGYRVWSWDAIGLKSLNGELWMPGQPLSAACRTLAERAEDGLSVHDAPQMNCTCGVYAAKSLDGLRALGYMRYGSIYGELYLWGTVVEHQLGWRAQYAYPKNFTLPLDMVPFGMSRTELWLTYLAAYGCDIFVHGKTENVPLWLTESGYDASGSTCLCSAVMRGTSVVAKSAVSSPATDWRFWGKALQWSSLRIAMTCTPSCGTGSG